MSLIVKLPRILETCKKQYEEGSMKEVPPFLCTQRVGGESETNKGSNMLAYGDNLTFMRWLLQNEWVGKVKLIYIDPPFYSKANYEASVRINKADGGPDLLLRQRAYKDTWEHGMEEYLSMLTVRLFYMRELLSEDGGIWIHLDWHVVHYVKILMDEIFGQDQFINEVIWTYKSGGVNKRHFARKHDTLLYYGKTKEYFFKAVKEKSYNRGLKPYRFQGVAEFQDEIGWHTMVNKKDVWPIDMVGRTAGERTGYATQKPELLVQQILESCTQEGDLCADFFCGSGTLASVASKMGRQFISCDCGTLAISHAYDRLVANQVPFSLQTMPQTEQVAWVNGLFSFNSKEQKGELRLLDYQVRDWQWTNFSEKDKGKLEAIIQKNPLSMIQSGSMGTVGADGIYEPKFSFRTVGDGCISCDELCRMDIAWEQLQAVVTDVFGNHIQVTWATDSYRA